jgi:(p)ppGpp synthase/HD superfamily hydrolase
MVQMKTIEETTDLIKRLFHGVTDKGGKPYADHCIRVMNYLPAHVSDDARHAALLHDVLEDTTLTANHLLHLGYSRRTVDLVKGLTRPVSVTYMEFIEAIVLSRDRELMLIKLADNLDNSNPERIAQLPESERGIANRYQRARQLLNAGLESLVSR